VKPPVSLLQRAGAQQVAGPVLGMLDEPNMIVTLERSPTRWAVRWALEPLVGVEILSGQSTARTSSSRISAAVPGSDAGPRP
jgi:hypothetical protein